MPVSKKRKKDGKPVKAHTHAAEGGEHAALPDAKPQHPSLRTGKPSNPFVTKQMVKSAQRGR
ncbi:MAG: hypothetical protein WCC48_09945 [Anaeromyxobacteraceae bacterium]